MDPRSANGRFKMNLAQRSSSPEDVSLAVPFSVDEAGAGRASRDAE